MIWDNVANVHTDPTYLMENAIKLIHYVEITTTLKVVAQVVTVVTTSRTENADPFTTSDQFILVIIFLYFV
jgi:hypothetical protein